MRCARPLRCVLAKRTWMMTEQHHRALDDRAGQGECRETRFCWQPLRLILRWVLPRMEAEMFAVALVVDAQYAAPVPYGRHFGPKWRL